MSVEINHQLFTAGCRRFSESSPLILITREQYDKLPDGFQLALVNGEYRVKGVDQIKLDVVRGHHLECGVATEAAKIAFGRLVVPGFHVVEEVAAPPAPEPILVKFHHDFGRMGDLDGLFICDRAEYNAALGKTADFGEALGKHSEIFCIVDRDNMTVVSSYDDEKIAWLERIVGAKTISGYNPLEYLSE
jgi:hypothetical protein